MPSTLAIILDTFVTRCITFFDDKLLDIRLFGSYARGDQDDFSDVDLLVLLEFDDIESKKYITAICDIATDISLANDGIDITPHVCGKDLYDKMKDFPGFYNNVMKEGISMYARQY